MERFAHVFDFTDIGQVLILKDTDEDQNPAVKIHFTLPNFGVNQNILAFEDNEEGYEGQDRCFEAFSDQAYAHNHVEQLIDQVNKMRLSVI